ncbi:psychosine receptor [Biomphalaria glabrata]|nr:psychosine receptor-like [Biomphalaria glabrata]
MSTSEILTIDPLITKFFLVFNLLVCAETVGLFGILGNIFNIWNFFKQGLNNSVTVTLALLGVSEIGALVALQGYNIVSMPWMSVGSGVIDPFALRLIFFYLNGYFIRVSGLITAYATFERCVSVFWPFKAKLILTRNMAVVVNFTIYFVLLMYILPIFYVVQFEYDFSPQFNKTVFSFSLRRNAGEFSVMAYVVIIMTDIAIPYLIFLINIICTSFIIRHLKTKVKWRKCVTHSFNRKLKKHKMKKEKRVMVMLVTLSVVFVVCLLPHCAVLTAFILQYNKGDKVSVTYSFTFLLETINCSVSCIIYYKMSSKYREVATKMLGAFKKFNFICNNASTIARKGSKKSGKDPSGG